MRITTLSEQYLYTPVNADVLGGLNISNVPAFVAVVDRELAPVDDDWQAGTWVVVDGVNVIRTTVSNMEDGRYGVWVKLTPAGQTIVERVGPLRVVDGVQFDLVVHPDDVLNALRRDWEDEDEETYVEDLLEDLQAEVEAYINRPIAVREFTEQYRSDGTRGVLVLRNAPVHQVTAISVDGVEVDPATYDVLPYGIVAPPHGVITVTYTAGLTGSKLKLVRRTILRAAVREVAWRNADMQGITSASLDGTALRLIGDGTGGLTDDDREKLRSLRRRVKR